MKKRGWYFWGVCWYPNAHSEVAALSCCKKIWGLGESPNQCQAGNKAKKIMPEQAITSPQNQWNKENAHPSSGLFGH